jgi:hypothetical protein
MIFPFSFLQIMICSFKNSKHPLLVVINDFFFEYTFLTLQSYHRELLEQRQAALQSQPTPRPPTVHMQARKMLPVNAAKEPGKSSAIKNLPTKRTRDRKSSSKQTHRSKVLGLKESVQL